MSKSSELAEKAERFGLTRVGARPPLPTYLKQVWERRDFTLSLARYRIQSENERNRLGMAWVLLRPSFQALVYGTVFGFIMTGASRPDNFVSFLVIGVFSLEFFNSSMNGGAKAIISNTSLVQSLPFPRMVLPLAKVLENLMNFMPTLALMFILAIIFGSRPDWSWFLFIPLVALFTIFNLGVALIFSRITVHFRDLSQLIPFVSRMIFYTSGVFFDPSRLLEGRPPILGTIYDWHPLHNVLSISRGILLEDHQMPVEYWFNFSVWAVVLVTVGTVFFWKAEERYGRAV